MHQCLMTKVLGRDQTSHQPTATGDAAVIILRTVLDARYCYRNSVHLSVCLSLTLVIHV